MIEGVQDQLPLDFGHCVTDQPVNRHGVACRRRSGSLRIQGGPHVGTVGHNQLSGADKPIGTQQHGTVHYRFQLADIFRPVVASEQCQCAIIRAAWRQAIFMRTRTRKMSGEQSDVSAAILERRQADLHKT